MDKTFILKYIASVLLVLLISCDEFVEIGAPQTELTRVGAFSSDATATAAVMDMYAQMISGGFASGGQQSFTYLSTLSSDEYQNYGSGPAGQFFAQFNNNDISPENPLIYNLWSDLYQYIFKANAIIEGIEKSNEITPAVKGQLLGEARFVRAFSYFYLVNLFGRVPLVLSTDYRVNAMIARTDEALVYQQILTDLIDAQTVLDADYNRFNGERVRPVKQAATAMLARVYLFMQQWQNAEAQASAVIAHESQFSLVSIDNCFSKNNTESIWQLWNNAYANEVATFYLFSAPPGFGAMRSEFATGFEHGDLRQTKWLGSIHSGADTYYFPIKYKSVSNEEYSTVLRLAELYLIRAEARAQLGNIAGSLEDVNLIRGRAGLAPTPAADLTSLLAAIGKERKAEFFTEWGHRWLDLKRTSRTTDVLGAIKSTWQATDILYPIPKAQLANDQAMQNDQNPGY